MKVNILYTKNPLDMDTEIHIEFEHHDFWNLDIMLAHIIHPALVQFRERALNPDIISGYPAKLSSHEQWIAILDKMIYSFFHIKEFYPDAPENVSDYKLYYAAIEEGLSLFAKYYTALWE